MKKILAVASMAFAMVATAAEPTCAAPSAACPAACKEAPQKALVVKVASLDAINAAVAKIGEMVMFPMLAPLAAEAIAQNPLATEFGPARSDAPVTVVCYVKNVTCETSVKDLDDLDRLIVPVVLYPTTKTKAEFLAKPNAKEEDGVVKIGGSYITFSEDGKWIAASEKPCASRLALSEVACAEKPLDGKLFNAKVNKPALVTAYAMLKTLADAEPCPAQKAKMEFAMQIVQSIESAKACLVVSDKGIDVGTELVAVKDSILDKLGNIPFAACPFASLDKEVVSACASAPGARLKLGFPCGEQIKIILDELKARDAKVDSFKIDTEGTSVKCTLDVAALAKYLQSDEPNKIKIDDAEKFGEELGNKLWHPIAKLDVAADPDTFSFAIAGADMQTSVSERFGKVITDAAEKKPYAVVYTSLYGFLRTFAEKAVPTIEDAQTREMLSKILTMVPTAEHGGMASMSWKKCNIHKGFARISTEEIKSFGMAANIIAGQVMSMGMNAAIEESDDDDDED